ncbi:MAG: hypothetical protein HY763_00465 [Planctomycetes bacterium]|nr:hypothetical protein [Planctomycetota bacterium]
MRSTVPSRRPTWPRAALALLVAATCLRVWLGPIALVEEAQAQIPDSGLQRKQLLEETRRTNELLLEIKQLLATQTLNVRIRSADNP